MTSPTTNPLEYSHAGWHDLPANPPDAQRLKNILRSHLDTGTNDMTNARCINETIDVTTKLVNGLNKLRYLKECKNNSIIPGHIICPLINLENIFNKDFLKNNKPSFFNNIASNLLDSDIKQCYWIIKKREEELLKLVNKNFSSNSDLIKSEIDTFKSSTLEKCNDKINRKVNRKINPIIKSPYHQKNSTHKPISTIYSNNLKYSHNTDKNRELDPIDMYNNLHTHNWVINLTKEEIPSNILNLLSLGDGFNILPNTINFEIAHVIADVENIIQYQDLHDNHKNHIRNEICNTLTNYSKNKSIYLKHLDKKFTRMHNKIRNDIKELKNFQEHHPDIKILKTDKTKKTVLITANEYHNKMEILLNDKSTYHKIRKDPGDSIMKELKSYVNKLIDLGFIDKKQKTTLINNNYTTPRVHGLIKAHKSGFPIRPILNNIGGPTELLSKFLNPALNFLNKENSYDCKNAIEFLTKLEPFKKNIEYSMVSYDIESLFTNIPLELVYNLIEKNWPQIEPYTPIKNKVTFLQGIKLICSNSYFKYNGDLYRQKQGLPMGGVMSVNLSGIVINHLLNNIMSTYPAPPLFIAKYIDDIFALILPEHKIPFLDALNKLHQKLKFTIEEESDNKLRFLDVSLIRTNTIIKSKWTMKNTSSERILNFFSNHPHTHKYNIANNMIRKGICLTDKEYLLETKNKIFHILKKNGYPDKLVNKIWYTNINKITSEDNDLHIVHSNMENTTDTSNKDNIKDTYKNQYTEHNTEASTSISKVDKQKEKKITDFFKPKMAQETTKGMSLEEHNKRNTEETNQDRYRKKGIKKKRNNFVTLTHIQGITRNITNKLRTYNLDNLTFAYKPINKLGSSIYSNMKDKIEDEVKTDVVYEVDCNDCHKKYIGQTGQYLRKRMNDHKYDCNNSANKNKNKTALADHALTLGHTFNLDNPKILYSVRKRRNREIIENICISKKENDAVNYKTDAKTVGTFYSSVIQNINIR